MLSASIITGTPLRSDRAENIGMTPPDRNDREGSVSQESAGAASLAQRLWKSGRALARRTREEAARALKANVALVVLVLLSALATGFTLSGGLLAFNDDTFFPLNLSVGIERNLFGWYEGFSSSPNLAVLLAPLYAEYLLVGSLVVVQATLLFALFVLSGCGSAFLCRTATQTRSPLAEFVCGFFYTFNFYSVSVVWTSFRLWGVFYALLPLILALYLLSLRAEVLRTRLALLLAASFLAGLPGAFPAPILALTLFVFSVLVVGTKARRKAILNFGLFGLVFLFANLYVIVPTLLSLQAALAQHVAAEPPGLFFAFPQAQNLVNSIRLLGYEFIWYWGWGVPNYAWADSALGNPGLILSSFAPFVFSVYGLLTKNPAFKMAKRASAALLFIGLVVSSAGGTPLGIVAFYVLQALHLAQIYEIPFVSFGPLILVAYLLLMYLALLELAPRVEPVVAGLRAAWTKLKRGIARTHERSLEAASNGRVQDGKRGFHHKSIQLAASLVPAVLVAAIILNSYPVWTGQVVPGALYRGPDLPSVPSGHVKVPADYVAFDDFARGLDHAYGMLVLPPYSPAFRAWEPQGEAATDPLIEYFVGGMTVINLDSLGPSPVIPLVNGMIVENASSATFLSVMAHLAVRYILLEKDWLDIWPTYYKLSIYSNYLAAASGNPSGNLSALWNSTNLTLYEVRAPEPFRILHATGYAYGIPNSLESLEEFCQFGANDGVSAVPVASQTSPENSDSHVLSSYIMNSSRGVASLNPGNYSVFTAGSLEGVGVAHPPENVTIHLGAASVPLNLAATQAIPSLLSGTSPVGEVSYDGAASAATWVDGNPSYALLNQSGLGAATSAGGSSGWTLANSTGAVSSSEGNLTVPSSIPSVVDIGFRFKVTANPTGTSYAGVFAVSSPDSSKSIGIVIRLGKDNSSGGILLIENSSISVDQVAYANLPLAYGQYYSLNAVFQGNRVKVALDGTSLEFLTFGQAVTEGNYTLIDNSSHYEAFRFLAEGLPIEISDFSASYYPLAIEGVLFRQAAPGGANFMPQYSFQQITPVAFSFATQGAMSAYLVVLTGYYGFGWILSPALSPAATFPIFVDAGAELASGLSGLINFVYVASSGRSWYLVYGPQVPLNAATLVSTATLAIGATAWGVTSRKRGTSKTVAPTHQNPPEKRSLLSRLFHLLRGRDP